MKVLVADDDPVARKVLSAFLRQSQYEAVMVESGAAALAAMSGAEPPSIAILDWVMPDSNGPELCQRLRALRPALEPYLLVLSAKKDKGDIAAALEAGADDFLVKPFNMQEMLARLRVGERVIQRQTAFLARIEALTREVAAQAERSAPPEVFAAPEPPAMAEEPAAPVFGAETIHHVMIDSLREIGVDQAVVPMEESEISVPGIGWMGLQILQPERWVDVFVRGDLNDILGHGSREEAAHARLLLAAMAHCLQQHLIQRGVEILAPHAEVNASEPPLTPLGLPCPAQESYFFRVGRTALAVDIFDQPNPVQTKETEKLRVHEILAAPYPPLSTHEVPLLHRGVALNDRYLEKLASFTTAAAHPPPVLVYAPSPLARQYLLRGAENLAGAGV